MLLIDSITCEMPEYLELLSTTSTVEIDRDRLVAAIKDANWGMQDWYNLALMWLRIESGGMYSSVTPDKLIDFLERVNIDLSKKKRGKSDAISLDIHKVLQPLVDRGVQEDVLSNYITYKSFITYHRTLSKLLEKNMYAHITGGGRTQVTFDTHIEERENLRAYYSDIALLGIPKRYSNIITTKNDDYFLAWVDLPQADWRVAYNLFIRDDKNFAEMNKYEDAYEGIARLVTPEDQFDYEEFKLGRKEYKVHCLKVFYNSSSKTEVAARLREYYLSCERYAHYVFDLRTLYYFKIPIPVTSYFGFTQYIPEAVYPDAFISKGLNTPVQTFTSHIVMELVSRVLKMFWSLGYTKDDIDVYFVRHDEPIFQFRKTILKDAWILKKASEIVVPGFTPLLLEYAFGSHYKEVDEYLQHEVETAMTGGPVDETDNIDTTTLVAHEYNPVGRVESIFVKLYQKEDLSGTRVSCMDYRTNSSFDFVIPGICDSLLQAATLLVGDYLPEVYPGLQYLLVRNNFLTDLTNINGVVVKFLRSE